MMYVLVSQGALTSQSYSACTPPPPLQRMTSAPHHQLGFFRKGKCWGQSRMLSGHVNVESDHCIT